MNATGSDQRRLATSGGGLALEPAWSPDSRRTYFSNTTAGLEYFDLDSNKRFNLTEGRGRYPDASPDGQKLLYSVDEGGNFNLFTIKTNGANPYFLTAAAPSSEIQGDWSPDGRQIAFTNRSEGNDEIYLINADGSNPKNLTNFPADDSHPTWSPR